MSDWESICADAQYDEELILDQNRVIELYDYDYAKRLKKSAKINEQPPLVQKYWLGRLAYELAIRNEKVIAIIEKCNSLSNQVDYDSSYQQYSPMERCLVLSLHDYGFTSQPETNVLKTEHTSFPTRLINYEFGYIEIHTVRAIEKLLQVLDGATAKAMGMNVNGGVKIGSIENC